MRNLRNYAGMLTAMASILLASNVLAQEPAVNSSEADALIAEIKAAKPPPFDRSKMEDKEYRQQYSEQVKQAMTKRAELAKQFYEKYPDHPQAGKMMEERW